MLFLDVLLPWLNVGCSCILRNSILRDLCWHKGRVDFWAGCPSARYEARRRIIDTFVAIYFIVATSRPEAENLKLGAICTAGGIMS